MKIVLTTTVALAMVMTLASLGPAYETDFDDLREFDRNLPGWKLGRGVVNIISGPHELITHVTNNAIKGAYHGAYDGGLQGYLAGSVNGMIAGTGKGMLYALRRMTTGALEILTFWKPEYSPTMEPLYGTRNLAFGYRDYRTPGTPFWYGGPER